VRASNRPDRRRGLRGPSGRCRSTVGPFTRSSRSTSAVARHSAASRSATAARLLASARSAWCVSLPALPPLPLGTTARESIRCSTASVRSRRSAAITVSAISAALRRRMRWPSASWQQGWRRHGLRVIKSPAHRGAGAASAGSATMIASTISGSASATSTPACCRPACSRLYRRQCGRLHQSRNARARLFPRSDRQLDPCRARDRPDSQAPGRWHACASRMRDGRLSVSTSPRHPPRLRAGGGAGRPLLRR
jgi:hypothetical protein